MKVESELAKSLKAKWDWADNRYPAVTVTKAEQVEIVDELNRLHKRAEGFKALLVKIKKEQGT